jgi:hypothetical protein
MSAATNFPGAYRLARWLVVVAATGIALVSSRDYAGGWNDGSRLATVEAIVDQHTLAIDESIFVKPSLGQADGAPTPYPKNDPGLMLLGTGDKLLIDRHFYSDKSPVPAVAMAAMYQVWQWGTGLTARDAPDRFCYVMILLTSGLAYVVAVWSIFRIGSFLGLSLCWSLALTASFALATVALPYVRHVNNHIMLLGVTAALMLALLQLGAERRAGRVSRSQLLWLGGLTGLGYTIDLGAGPVLLVCTLGVVIAQSRRFGSTLVFLLAALPWLALHHGVNFLVGGTFKPANAVPEYFQWPGCVFSSQTMTGTWNHHDLGHFLKYAAALLVGKNGFLGHNLALFLAVPAIVLLLRRRTRELPEVLFTGLFCGGTWLAYALTSTNYSGQCCSIRWFVPLLAPAYFVLGVLVREVPRLRADFMILSAWGAVIAGLAWSSGPWMRHMVPGYWFLQGGALLSWAGFRIQRHRRESRQSAGDQGPRATLNRAA